MEDLAKIIAECVQTWWKFTGNVWPVSKHKKRRMHQILTLIFLRALILICSSRIQINYLKNHAMWFPEFFLGYISHGGHAPKMRMSEPSIFSKWENMQNYRVLILICLTVSVLVPIFSLNWLQCIFWRTFSLILSGWGSGGGSKIGKDATAVF